MWKAECGMWNAEGVKENRNECCGLKTEAKKLKGGRNESDLLIFSTSSLPGLLTFKPSSLSN